MPLNYDGGSLVPDLNGALRVVMGIAQQREQERREEERTSEVTGLQDQLPAEAGTDALLKPDNVRILQRMAQLDPEAAQFAISVARAQDQSHLEGMKSEAEEASRVYQAFLDSENPADSNRFLADTIRELDAKGKDTSKLRQMIGMKPDQQRLFARKQVILAGDASTLATNGLQSLKDALDVQSKQLDMMKTSQEMQFAAAEEARKADKALAEKTATEEQIAKSNQQAIDETTAVNAQIDEVLATLPGAYTGRIGQVAAFVSPTGDTATKENKIETLKSMLAINKLLDMKRSSANGSSGFGALSQEELRVIQNSIANIKATQDDKVLMAELEKIRKVFSRINQNAGGSGFTSPQGKQGGPDAPMSIGRFTVTPVVGPVGR